MANFFLIVTSGKWIADSSLHPPQCVPDISIDLCVEKGQVPLFALAASFTLFSFGMIWVQQRYWQRFLQRRRLPAPHSEAAHRG